MKLENVIQHIETQQIIGNDKVSVSGVCFDSRETTLGSLFIAIKGTRFDGHLYIDTAIEKGAVAVLCEYIPEKLHDDVTYVIVKNTAKALSKVAQNWWGNPSERLTLVGVTGTNGKTTVSTLLYQLSQLMGFSSGLISTVEIRINDTVIPSTHTTPNAWELNKLLHQMVEQKVAYVFMEVSSHGIDQYRVDGLQFSAGVFTNLTHDHLDYHKTFAHYRDTKKRFFDQLPKTAFALSNADDKNGTYMLQNTSATTKMYALKTLADFKGKVLEYDISGMWLEFSSSQFWSFLIGKFNAYNLLAVYGTAVLLGWDEQSVLLHMSKLTPVNGRFQHYISKSGVVAIVDYAHTPDALQNIIDSVNKIRKKGKLITVVGCGGNRDKEKRPKMAEIAATFSDEVILTSDNPRYEDPEDILNDMEKGIPQSQKSKVMRITDRKQALQVSCKMAQQGDVILVAGKGHETYQEVKGVKHDFDDFKWMVTLLNQ